MKRILSSAWLVLLFSLVALSGCRDIEEVLPPTITIEQDSYTVKQNRNLLLQAKVTNDTSDALYSWSIDGKEVGKSKEYLFNESEVGIYHLTFQVVTRDGSAKKDVQVTVTALQLPIITLDGADNIVLETNEEIILKPVVENKEGLTFSWVMDNKVVSTDPQFPFSSKEPGVFHITLNTTNEDGEDSLLIQITVVEEVPLAISFKYPQQSASLGRTIRIIPDLTSLEGVTFTWSIDGNVVEQEESSHILLYQPESLGKSEVKVVATKGDKRGEATIQIHTVQPEQTFRPAKASSSPYSTEVFEFLPAPGQFVNEGYSANTMAEACAYAQGRLQKSEYVSLGGFGGYIVVGFDHSIPNSGDYDFAVKGNAFKGSSEPGIVWVMQDENGNGLPDDNWYELRGCETGKAGTIQDYEVTYTKPSTPKTNTPWKDNRGNEGVVEWLGFHQQPYYYPNWVKERSYILRGTRLTAKTEDQSGNGTYWVNKEFDWGYADNFSPIDMLTEGNHANAVQQANHFKIIHAITHDGQEIHLEYIDFIKVQTGVNANAGHLGEISTEVVQFVDMHIDRSNP